MTMLARERCTACRRDSPSVTPEEIAELHPQTPEWELIDMDNIPKLAPRLPVPAISRRLLISPTVWVNWRKRRAIIPASQPNGGVFASRGGLTRFATCTATTSSWPPRPTRFTLLCCVPDEQTRKYGNLTKRLQG